MEEGYARTEPDPRDVGSLPRTRVHDQSSDISIPMSLTRFWTHPL